MVAVKSQQKIILQPMVRPQFHLVEFLLLRMSYDYRNSVPSTTRFIPKYPSRSTQVPDRDPLSSSSSSSLLPDKPIQQKP